MLLADNIFLFAVIVFGFGILFIVFGIMGINIKGRRGFDPEESFGETGAKIFNVLLGIFFIAIGITYVIIRT